jgi:hypothetical protein
MNTIRWEHYATFFCSFFLLPVTSLTQARGRIQILNGTPVTDCSTPIRGGGHFSLDYTENSGDSLDVFAVKHNGFNAVHVYTECYWTNPPGKNTKNMDDLVRWTKEAGLYCFMTIGGCDKNGQFDLNFVKAFWNIYAPRYADRTHVVYEIQNEPGLSFASMNAEEYKIIRSHAKETHVCFASYHYCRKPADMLKDIAEIEKLTQVDWTNASIAWHAYTGGYDNIVTAQDIVTEMRKTPYATICTEFEGYTEDTPELGYTIDARALTAMFERENYSYLHFIPIDHHDAFRERILKEGYHWIPDFGRFPEPSGNLCPTMKAPYVDAGPDTILSLPNSSVTLQSRSDDPDGSIVSYRWRKRSGPNILIPDTTASAFSLSNLQKGVYQFIVRVVDNDNLYDLDEVKVVVAMKHKIPGKIEAEEYADMEGIQTEPTSDIGGGLNCGWFDAGDWMDYRVDASCQSLYDVELRVALNDQFPGGRGRFAIGPHMLSTFSVPTTGGWQKWTTIHDTVQIGSGEQLLRLAVVRGQWNLNWMRFSILTTGVSEKPSSDNTQKCCHLYPVYPNPFNGSAHVRYDLASDSEVEIALYGLSGKREEILVRGNQTAGPHEIILETIDLASGMYVLRLRAGHIFKTQKIVSLK